jgi:predicted phosphoribosyltransferase
LIATKLHCRSSTDWVRSIGFLKIFDHNFTLDQMRQLLAGPFQDRTDAGRVLSDHLLIYQDHPKLLVLALPRGGVPVAVEVARQLRAPLEVCLVRKLAVPNQPELIMGAIASRGIQVLNETVIREHLVTAAMIDTVIEHEQGELKRRERTYRGMRPMLDVAGHTVILIDDGLTTGATMRTAVAAIRQAGPERIVVAAPVGSRESCEQLRREADEVICAFVPEPLYSVGRWYRDYSPIMDREIRALLDSVECPAIASCVH